MTDRPIIDKAAGRLCLGNGWHAVEAIDMDGDREYWILDPQGDNTDRSVPIPDHELVGPLPPITRQRLARPLQPRCGRPRMSDGRPCGMYVARPGDACHHHRVKATP
jgi:hypothetical protein